MGCTVHDWVINKIEGSAFRVTGITHGREHIPDGWLIDNIGRAINPKFCRKYEGAVSALHSPPEAKE